MALSNMLNEPRRELTESAIGIAVLAVVVGAAIYVDGWIARALCGGMKGTAGTGDMVLGYALGFLIMILGGCIFAGVVFGSHALGESVCAWLARHGADPRPDRNKAKNVADLEMMGAAQASPAPNLYGVQGFENYYNHAVPQGAVISASGASTPYPTYLQPGSPLIIGPRV